MHVYWTTSHWGRWRFFLGATDQGLCYIGSPNAAFSELETWVERQFPNGTLIEDASKLQTSIAAINAYLDGDEQPSSIPLHIRGTSFQQSVWKKMREVPYGETATYSDIATKIGNKKAVRAVASAIGANPLLIVLPCHRIIAKNGGLTGYRGGLAMKEALLKLEQTAADSCL